MTIKLTHEEAQQVLDALGQYPIRVWGTQAKRILQARLAQPEQEPVGWIYEDDEGRMMFSQMPQNPPLWEPVYKAQLREKNSD
jgi:hypothetical protein